MSRLLVRVVAVAALVVAIAAVTPGTIAMLTGGMVPNDLRDATTAAMAIVLAVVFLLVIREILLLGRVGTGMIVEVQGAPANASALLESDTELRRLGFAPIGRLEFTGFSSAPVHHTKYANPVEPFVSASVVEERRQTLFWSVWSDGRTLTSVTPSIGTAHWPNILIQSTNDGIDAAHRLHVAVLRSIGDGSALQPVATIADVLEANRIEQATLLVAARRIRRRRILFAAIFAVAWLVIVATDLLT